MAFYWKISVLATQTCTSWIYCIYVTLHKYVLSVHLCLLKFVCGVEQSGFFI